MEHVTVRTIRNTAAFLRDASSQLLTIGTDPRARRRIGDLQHIIEEKQKEEAGKKSRGLKTAVPGGSGRRPGIAVVLGNEETGLPAEVKDACSVLLRIPGTGLMESLNVAQTATLFMQKIFEL